MSYTAGTRGQVVLCAILGRKCHKKMEHSHTQWVLKCPVYSPTSPRRRLGEMSPIHGRAAQSSYGSMQIVDKTAGSGGRQPYRVCAVADAD